MDKALSLYRVQPTRSGSYYLSGLFCVHFIEEKFCVQ